MNNFFEYIFYDIFKKVIYKIESKKVYRNIIGGNPSDWVTKRHKDIWR